jgi:hypothetical protein
MFSFDKLITPRIISSLYAICFVLLVLLAVVVLWNGNLGGAIVVGLCALFCRIFFELMILKFKSVEYLRRICEKLEGE